MLYALCSLLVEARGSPRKPAEARGSPRKPAEARGSPRKPAEARGSPNFVDNFYGFLDDFFTALFVLLYMQYKVCQCKLYLFCFICSTKFVNASFICFALYAVQSLSMQYKSLLPFLRGGGGGGTGGV
jgi:hypothetical protein